MIPWDFGLTNALKEKLNVEIFPSEPPEEFKKSPYLILEFKSIRQTMEQTARAEIQLKIADEEKPTSAVYDFIRAIKKAISQELVLKQGKSEIGKANMKMEKVVMSRSGTILNLTALLQLKTIYEDEGESHE